MLPQIAVARTVWYRERIIVFLLILFIGYISTRWAVRLDSLADPTRLVLVSGKDILYAIPLGFLLYILGSVIVVHFTTPQAIRWYTFLFTVRVLIAIFLSMLFQFDDERGFHYNGIEQTYGLFSLAPGAAYNHLVNILYWAFGANILLPKMVNAFLGSLLPYFAFDIARWLFEDRKIAWRTFLLTGALPPFIIFSAVNLKEIATCFLLVLLVWVLAKPKSENLQRLMKCGICIWGLYWLRGEPLAALGITGVVSYYVLNMLSANQRFSSFVKVVGLLILTSLLIVPLLRRVWQVAWIRATSEGYFVERFHESRATVKRFMDANTPLSARNLTLLFIRGLFSPTPLRVITDRGIDTLLAALNMSVWYILFPLAVVGSLVYRQKSIVVAITVMIFGILFAATSGEVVGGDPYRHRMIVMGLVSALAAVGFEKDNMYRYRWILWLWILGAVGFTGLWFRLRLE